MNLRMTKENDSKARRKVRDRWRATPILPVLRQRQLNIYASQAQSITAAKIRRRMYRCYPFAVPLLGIFTWWCVLAWVIDGMDMIESPISHRDAIMPTYSVRSPGYYHSWRRIRARDQRNIYGDHDDFRVGKSCHWRRHWLWFWAYHWDCRDCGNVGATSWSQCRVLRRRGKCNSFAFQDWDGPQPRLSTTYNPQSSISHPVRLLTSYGAGEVRRVFYEQPECPQGIGGPCFDLRRCMNPSNEIVWPIAVYAYPGRARQELSAAMETTPSLSETIRPVFEPDAACLLMVHDDDAEPAITSSSWNRGRNHYVYGLMWPPPTSQRQYDMAALGLYVGTNSQIRLGYDVALPLRARWQPSPGTHINFENRPLLLGFRGTIQDTLHPYYQHRWLASEYLYDTPRVEINTQCKHKNIFGQLLLSVPFDDDKLPGVSTYEDMMLRSTFVFCPGGSHASSYRFTEALSAGGIPVILPEVVPPLSPELDWSECIVTVSQARIIDLPRILAQFSAQEIRERQIECQRLYQFIRHPPGEYQGLEAALQVWTLRIRQAEYTTRLFEEFDEGKDFINHHDMDL